MNNKTKKIFKQTLAILLSLTLIFSVDPLTNAIATSNLSDSTSEATAQGQESDSSVSQTNSGDSESGEKASDEKSGSEERSEKSKEQTSVSSQEKSLVAPLGVDGEAGEDGADTGVPETSTCKIVRGSETLYFDTLTEAIVGAADGETLEIFKSHTVAVSADTAGKNLTIKNICDPANDDENPTKNGSADEMPVVTFEAEASISVNSNVFLSGVIFDGGSNERSKPFATIENGYVLTVDDGIAGTLEATNTDIKNFNVTQSGTSGGAFCVNGSVILNSGQVTNCHSKAGDGGAVAFIDGGTFALSGGTLSSNGDEDGVSGSGVFSCKNATLNILGGEISGNSGVKGGVIYSQGSANTISVAGGEIKNNSSSQGGGAIYSEGGTVSVAGGSVIDNSTSEKGGAIYAESGTLAVLGGTISGNYASSGGGAIAFASANVEVSGGTISGNAGAATGDVACAGAAVEHTSSGDAGTLTISGSPVIYGNGMAASKETKDAIVTKANVNLTNASHFIVGELAQGAKVGFYNEGTLCDEDVQFATAASGDASTTKFLSNTFSNDKNQQYAAASGDGAAIKWSEPVCKILREGEAIYYESLPKAIEGALTGETIEILKSHTVTAVMDTKDKNLTIQNVNNPLNDAEDPNKNGSDDAVPVVTFGAAAKIAVNSNVTLKGVVFDGTNNNTRVVPGATVAAGWTLNISDGEEGTIAATSTHIKDFYNNNTGGNTTTGGGFVAVYGIVNMDGGTISGCKAYSYQFSKGGGSVASLLSAAAQFNLSGGTLTENGTGAIDSAWGNSTVTLWAGTFTMTGGTVSKNSVRTGGCVGVPDNCNTTVNLLGGEILENTSSGQGGAVYFGPKGTSTINIGGDVKIKDNTATIGSAVCGYAGTGKVTFNIYGTPEISGNTGKTNGVTGAALEGASYGDNIVMNVSGSPVIYGNKNSSNAAADLNPGTIAKLQIGDMGEGAKIGYYSNTAALVTNGNQFGTATKNPASGCKNVGGAFINDKDTSIISVASTSDSQVKWVKAVCKIQRTDNAIYYDSLSAAITGANAGAGGEEIEIFKSHSMAAAVSATKAVTIKNITDPKNDAENPNENGSTDATPVVTFTAAGRITVAANVDLEGVVFNGNSTNRTSSGFLIKAGSTLTISDGEEGELAKTETVLKNFVNTSTTNAAAGGLCLVNGTVTLTSGTISGCKASESATGTDGGGSVAFINATGLFKIEGGTVKENGIYKTGYSNQTPFYANGGTITMTGGTVRDNESCMGGFAMLRATATINVSGGEITSNRSGSGGGAIALCASTNTLNLSGDAKITDNFTTQDGAAITLRNTSTINISGSPQITGNTSLAGANAGAAIESDAYTSESTQVINISGSPIIKDNGKVAAEGGAITTKANINLGSAAKLQVSDLDEGAEIGYYNSATLCNTGVQFAVGTKNANKITNLTASFVNDRNENLKALSGGGTKIVWGTPTCKLITADTESHYATLDGAVTDATAGGTGESVEIYKSHTVATSMDTTNKPLTIKNITNPLNDGENPNLNGSTDTTPVVTFGSAVQLKINSDIDLKGVVFDGASSARTTPPIVVAAAKTLTVENDEASEGDTLDPTETILRNFVNNSTTNATAGGLFYVSGTVTMKSGTVSGCKANGSQWAGGGAVATINNGSTFNLQGGTVMVNGQYRNSNIYNDGPFVLNAGTFNMTGGTVKNNNSTTGGAVGCKSDGQTSGNCYVYITGGEISSNRALLDGGAVFCGQTTTCKVGGDAVIKNNFAAGSSGAIHLRSSSTLTIEGTPQITGNTSTKTRGTVGGAIEGLSYTNEGTVTIGGSPTIKDNGQVAAEGGAIATKANLNLSAASKLIVGDFGANANVGYYNSNTLCNTGVQFSTGSKNASEIKNLTATFSNDRNSSLYALSGGGTKIIWGVATCKLVKATNESHYASLDVAVSDATAGATDEVIEIYKSHTVSAAMDTTNKPLTIKNITDPVSDNEDPTLNGSTNAQPVVTFAAAGKITVASNCTFEGVVFNGNATVRSAAAVTVSANYTLSLKDGEDGAHPDGTVLEKTPTKFMNFYNSSANGGFLYVNGTVNMEGGTISGCRAYCATDAGSNGGSAAYISSTGTFTLSDGTVEGNGIFQAQPYGIGPFALPAGGTFNMTGGKIINNYGSHGGAVYSSNANTDINISGGEVSGNQAYYDGGAVYVGLGELNVSGGTFSGNYARRGGGALSFRTNSVITISGSPQITGNKCLCQDATTNAGAAIESFASTNEGKLYVSGSPVIQNNGKVTAAGGAISTTANIFLSSAADLIVSDLEEGAKIGYYNSGNLGNAGYQFATGSKNAKDITNLTASFVNDRNATLKALSGGGTKIVWGIPACKLVTADNESHYATLDAAITDATADATDERIEIYRSHTMTGTADTASKNLTIMNIINPANDDENPTLNGSDDEKPVVHFSDGTTKGRILVNSDIILNGVIFDGAKSDGTSVSRTNSGFLINAGYSLEINDGVAGELDATETVIKNFYNTSTSSATSGGGFAFVYGTLTLNSGTITGCNALASQWSGGGAVAVVYTPGVFNINGGLIDNNGSYGAGTEYCRTPVYVVGGKVNMTAGQVSNNKARSGGFIFTPDSTSLPAPQAECVDISGGVICNNSANYEGGAFFICRTTTLVIRGNAILMNNHADKYGSAVLLRLDTSGVLVKDNAVITKNTCGYTGASTCAGAISTPGNTYTCQVTLEGSPIIYNNTDGASHQANINLNKSGELSVGNLEPSALIGYWSNNGTQAKGATFGTGQAQASTLTHLSALVNDVYPTYLGSAGTGTSVVWPAAENANVKLKETRTINGEVMTFTHPFSTIGEAVDCANDLTQDNMIDGRFTFELLAASMDQKEAVSVNTGETKPLVLTTADSAATDGYPYRGTAGTPAVVKRAYAGDSMFTVEDGDDATHTTLTCTDVTIDGNKANYSCASKGGAFSVAEGNTLTLDGETTIQNNKSDVSGAALYANAANVSIKGDTKILSNTAPEFSAVEIDGGMSMPVEGNVKISENVNTSTSATAAVGCSDTASTLVLSGNLTIYDNKSSDDKQQNLFDDTALNDGTFIKIAEAGISEDAKIGVWAVNNYNVTNTFARTENDSSEEVANLECFINDRNASLTGYAGSDNRVIWSSLEPVTLKKTLLSAQEQDTWFVVQIKNTDTNEIYHQAIRVEAGKTTGEATVLLRSGLEYALEDADEQSTWRFSHNSTTTSGFATTDEWADVTGSIGTLKIVPPDDADYDRVLTLSTTMSNDEYVSDTRSVVNTIKVS